MKKGTELNLSVIKCQNKQGTDKLRSIHIRINAILYQNAMRYIDQALAIDMYRELCALGKELNELSVPDSAKAKRDELVSELRKRCIVLKDYRKIQNTEEDIPQIQSNINSWLHQFITAKNEGKFDNGIDLVLVYLKESKRLFNLACPYGEKLKTDTLVKANGELIGYIESKYSIIH